MSVRMISHEASVTDCQSWSGISPGTREEIGLSLRSRDQTRKRRSG